MRCAGEPKAISSGTAGQVRVVDVINLSMNRLICRRFSICRTVLIHLRQLQRVRRQPDRSLQMDFPQFPQPVNKKKTVK